MKTIKEFLKFLDFDLDLIFLILIVIGIFVLAIIFMGNELDFYYN